jgi:hypothetical protein
MQADVLQHTPQFAPHSVCILREAMEPSRMPPDVRACSNALQRHIHGMRTRQLERFKSRSGAALFLTPQGMRQPPQGDAGSNAQQPKMWLEALLERLPGDGLLARARPTLQRCLEVRLRVPVLV